MLNAINTPFNKGKVKYKDLDFPQTFMSNGHIYIISKDEDGWRFDYCLDTGCSTHFDDEEEVIPIEIEIHIVG